MKNIYVLYDHSVYTFRWLSTLLWAKKELKKRKYKIFFDNKLFYGIKQNINFNKIFYTKNRYDIILLAFHNGSDFYKMDYIDYLKKIKDKCNKLIWLDTSDSCGTTNFEVLPYVDKYLKKQIYADLNNYRIKYVHDRIFVDFYKDKYKDKLGNEAYNNYVFLDKKYEYKIGISWNVGLGNVFDHRIKFLLNLSNKKKNIKFKKPNFEKKYNLFFNGTVWDGIFGEQRKKSIDCILKNDLQSFDPNLRINRKKYYKYLSMSKFSISPFGFGEICNRDFETMKYGLVLVKPDMSHLKTFPEYFNSNYVSIDWNFDNFNSQIEKYNNKSSYIKIALECQEFYKKSISKIGLLEFVNHFIHDCLIE